MRQTAKYELFVYKVHNNLTIGYRPKSPVRRLTIDLTFMGIAYLVNLIRFVVCRSTIGAPLRLHKDTQHR